MGVADKMLVGRATHRVFSQLSELEKKQTSTSQVMRLVVDQLLLEDGKWHDCLHKDREISNFAASFIRSHVREMKRASSIAAKVQSDLQCGVQYRHAKIPDSRAEMQTVQEVATSDPVTKSLSA